MVNSTRCPVCIDGIGHEMDDDHAARVKELLAAAQLALANLQARSETNKKWSLHDQNTFEKLDQAIANAEGK